MPRATPAASSAATCGSPSAHLCWLIDTQRLALSVCLGTAFPTLERTHAVLGIQLGSGHKAGNQLGTGSQGHQNSMGFPFLSTLGFFKGQRKTSFSSGRLLSSPWLLFLLRAQNPRILLACQILNSVARVTFIFLKGMPVALCSPVQE